MADHDSIRRLVIQIEDIWRALKPENKTAIPRLIETKALPDEPVFVLRAQDILAADIVREWADRLAKVEPASSADRIRHASKVVGARKIADAMDEWGRKYGTKYPD